MRPQNDNSRILSARILYQTADAIKVYLLNEDQAIWVPKDNLPYRTSYFSGEEVELPIQKAWLH